MKPVFDTTVPVLVLKMGQYAIHHGTLGIIRSLGGLGVDVYAVVEDRFLPSAMSRYLRHAFVLDTLGAQDNYLTQLLAIGNQIGRLPILVPTDDYAAAFVAENADALQKSFRFPAVAPGLPRKLANKREMISLCKRIGVPCPAASVPNSVDDVHAFIEHARFPVVLKAADAQLLPKGARSTSIARDPNELLELYRLSAAGGADLILQEYIPEAAAEDWIYHGYVNPQTGCSIGFTGQKLRSYPAFAGPTTLGVSIPNAALARQSERLLKAIEYAGIMDLDYRLDKRDGQYKLLDFNPRIGANFRMFENANGVDVVRALHLDLTGRSVPASSEVYGRKFLVESHDFFGSIAYVRRGTITLGGWWRSLQGSKELAWFRWNDPLPAIVLTVRLALRVLGRALQRLNPSTRPQQHVHRTDGQETPVTAGSLRNL